MKELFLFLLQLKTVISHLSASYIQKVAEEVFKDENSDLGETIVNPIFGLLADGLGLTSNIRFFSPALKTFFKDGKRNYIEDMSEDPLTALVIELYPSPWGVLSTRKTLETDTISLFKENIEENIKLFAQTFISIIENNSSEIRTLQLPLPLSHIRDLMLEKSTSEIFKDDKIRLLVIHAYIILALDPAENDNKDYLKLYLEKIVNGVKNSRDKLILNMKVDKSSIEEGIKSFNIITSFRYSQLNRFEIEKIIPSYNREDGSFDENVTFKDASELALLQLCNCLFLKEGYFSLKHLKNPSDDLIEFYKKYNKPFILENDIRKDWLKVVSCLKTNELKLRSEENAEISIFPTQDICYINENRNELSHGIINMMNVLMTITGTDKEEIFKNINDENLFERLKILINEISIEEDEKKVAQVFEIDDFKIKRSDNKKKIDFVFDFGIEFNYSNGNKIRINVINTNNIFHLKFSPEEDVNSDQEFNSDESITNESIVNSISTLKKIFKNFFVFEENDKFDMCSLFNKVFLSGTLQKVEDKKNNYDEFYFLFEKLISYGSKKELELIGNIVKRIIESINYTENEESYFFIFRAPEQKISNFEDLFKHLEKTNNLLFRVPENKISYFKDLFPHMEESLKTKNKFMMWQWDEYLKNQKSEIKTIAPNSVPDFETKEFYKMIYNKLSEYKNLEYFYLFGKYLNSDDLREIIKELKECKNLVELKLSNFSNVEIPEEIGELTNLRILNFKNCVLKDLPVTFENLENLEELDLSSNDFSDSFFDENFSNLKNLKKLDISGNLIRKMPSFFYKFEKLEELDLSRNALKEFPENKPNCPNLKKIDLSRCHLNEVPKFIFNLKNLETLNLHRNYISDDAFIDIKPEFKNLNNFTISRNRISHIPEFLKELDNLKILDISENAIHSISKSFKPMFLKLLKLKFSDDAKKFPRISTEEEFGYIELRSTLGSKLLDDADFNRFLEKLKAKSPNKRTKKGQGSTKHK